MKRPRIIVAGIGLGALATAGGITAASAGGAYNGHPLYTFADDHADQVTGQGVQDFFVATPGLAPIANSAGSPRPAPAVPSRGYGY